MDIESKREEYKGFGGNGDDDDDDQGDGDRQKSLHQIGRVPHKETNVTGHGGAATSNKLGAGGRRQSAGSTAAIVATGGKQSAVATGGKQSAVVTGGKQSTGCTGTQHNRRSSRTKKEVDYTEMPELED